MKNFSLVTIDAFLCYVQGCVPCKILWQGGGGWQRGEKIKNKAVGEKKEKGGRKREENYIKERGKLHKKRGKRP